MAAITAALIKQVREETGAGMMDVKKALTEAEGDVARAKEIIRAKGIQAAGKREGRKAQENSMLKALSSCRHHRLPGRGIRQWPDRLRRRTEFRDRLRGQDSEVRGVR